MAEQLGIHPANLRTIENDLRVLVNDINLIGNHINVVDNNVNVIANNMNVIDNRIDTVDNNVKLIYNELDNLSKEFRQYVELAGRQHNLTIAETRLIKIRQELETKYGHYAEVRRTTTGILQANDLGIIRKETITSVTEELMVLTPNYWLAPCLVALSSWINDSSELAEKALFEGIKRNDEKSSLLFALICQRADRKSACLKWIQRYLANQNEEHLDRKCVIILEAYAGGLLGADTEGLIQKQMNSWITSLSETPGFIEKQTKQWADALNMKRIPIDETSYTYLKKYSNTWNLLSDILEGAHLHEVILKNFESIFEKQASTESVKNQLDELLMSLVTDFDDDEIPLRRDESYNQFIIDYEGDLHKAKVKMNVEQTAFDTYKDFTQLLTDAAMKPENAHSNISSQKLAIALSRDWIINGYHDIIAKNRMNVPDEIEININNFSDKTTDGENEEELVHKFNIMMDNEKSAAFKQIGLSVLDRFSFIGGTLIGVIGLIMWFTTYASFGFFAIMIGIGMVINYIYKRIKSRKSIAHVETEYEIKRDMGLQILRATLAEVVDFRIEFLEKDSESQKVTDFLEQISPEQFVRKLSNTNRKIRV
jgi:hypothetical protein